MKGFCEDCNGHLGSIMDLKQRWSAVFQLKLLLCHIAKLSHSNVIGLALTLIKLFFRNYLI